MAVKLVDSTQLDADLGSVANAIRTKGGTSGAMSFPSGFISAINAIPTGVVPTGTKYETITSNGTTVVDVSNYAYISIAVSVAGGGNASIAQDANGYLVLGSTAVTGGNANVLQDQNGFIEVQ